MALVTFQDRKRYGLALALDVKENVALAAMRKCLKALGWVDYKKAAERGREMTTVLNIKTPSLEQKVKFLSGGNQQKVVIGKWLTADTDIIAIGVTTHLLRIRTYKPEAQAGRYNHDNEAPEERT